MFYIENSSVFIISLSVTYYKKKGKILCHNCLKQAREKHPCEISKVNILPPPNFTFFSIKALWDNEF